MNSFIIYCFLIAFKRKIIRFCKTIIIISPLFYKFKINIKFLTILPKLFLRLNSAAVKTGIFLPAGRKTHKYGNKKGLRDVIISVSLLFLIFLQVSILLFSDLNPVIPILSCYFANSVALVSLITLTLICPGYSSSSSIFLAISLAKNNVSLSEI